MFESRCGICCNACNAKENYGFDCPGCLKMEDAFWGECEVKHCSEGKGLNHCGECPELPCDIIKRYSYDISNGDNGKRIEQCLKWKSE